MALNPSNSSNLEQLALKGLIKVPMIIKQLHTLTQLKGGCDLLCIACDDAGYIHLKVILFCLTSHALV